MTTPAQEMLDLFPDSVKAELILKGFCPGCLMHPSKQNFHLDGCTKMPQSKPKKARSVLDKKYKMIK